VVVASPAPTTTRPTATVTISFVAGATPTQWMLSGRSAASATVQIETLSGTRWSTLSNNTARATTTGAWSMIFTGTAGTVLRAKVGSVVSSQITLQ
jgi:hypothetical protein